MKTKLGVNMQEIPNYKPSRQELLEMLDEMIKSYDRLPQGAMIAPVTQADLLSVLMLMSALFRSGDL